MSTCPPPETLQFLLADEPGGSVVTALAGHVEQCHTCQNTLEQMTQSANRSHSGSAEQQALTGEFLDQLRRVAVRAARPDAGDATACWPHVHGYEIVSELGRGGMGVVYKARQVGLNRLVALKMILDGPHASAEHLIRFRREAEAVARLQHPQIVQIYEIGDQDGRPFFSMEYLDGGSLSRKLAGAPQEPRAAADFVILLARAVHAAHLAGILHRDLKPANILLQEGNHETHERHEKKREEQERSQYISSLSSFSCVSCVSWFTPKIADFGLAKLLSEGVAPSAGEATASSVLLGSPSYMAPEQARPEGGPVGPAADVYALGAILYELLTGRPPFRGATPLETVLQVVHEEPVSPARLQPTLPRDLETICLTCLQKEPRKRYPTAAALAEDLRRFLANEPIQARPTPAWERGLKWVRRRPALAALLTVTAAAVLSLVLGGLWYNARLRAQVERADANLLQGLAVVEQMVLEMGLQRLPTLEAREQSLTKAIEFYRGFLAYTGNPTPPIRQGIGRAHWGLGLIHQWRGNVRETEAHYQEARTIHEKLVAEFPDAADHRHYLAATYNNLGQLYGDAGRTAEAEDLLDKARGLHVELIRAFPGHPDYQQRLAVTYHTLGVVFHRAKEHEKARDSYLQAVAILELLVRDHPQITGYRRSLANSHVNLALEHQACGEPEQAITAVEKAVAALEDLPEDHPEYFDHAQSLGAACINRGLLAVQAGQMEAALEWYTRAVDTLEAVLLRSPHQRPALRENLATAHGGRGQALWNLNCHAEALPSWERLLEMDQGPEHDRYRGWRAVSLAASGNHARAAAEARALAEKTEVAGDILQNVAFAFATAMMAARQDARLTSFQREQLAEEYAASGVKALRKAHAAGYFHTPAQVESLLRETDYDPLRGRADFQELLRAVQTKPR